jgi:hypothetical protein
MRRALLLLALAIVLLLAGYALRGALGPGAGERAAPTVATSVDFIRDIGELHVLRASVKEIVTTPVGEATWLRAPGKLAIICHFDIKYKYDLHKARIVAGGREDGSRYCVIRLPRHEFEVSTGKIQFYDDQDGTWLGFTQKTPPDEKTRVLEAARRQAEEQAKVFLGDLEGDIQASARSTVAQIARAFGYSDVRVEFE